MPPAFRKSEWSIRFYASRKPPSSRGPGRGPFKAKTGVRIPVGAYARPGGRAWGDASPLRGLTQLQRDATFGVATRLSANLIICHFERRKLTATQLRFKKARNSYYFIFRITDVLLIRFSMPILTLEILRLEISLGVRFRPFSFYNWGNSVPASR